MEDPGNLVFSTRTDRRPARRKTTDPVRIATYGFLVVACIALVFMLRELVARGWRTAKPTPDTVVVQPLDPSAPEWVPEAVERKPKVYRCVARSGAVSLQSHPCAPGERTTAIVEARPDSHWEVARARQRQQQSMQAAAGMARLAGTSDGGGQPHHGVYDSDDRDARRARCASAKQQRDATLRAAGLSRTYDLLQRLDAVVYEACKGL